MNVTNKPQKNSIIFQKISQPKFQNTPFFSFILVLVIMLAIVFVVLQSNVTNAPTDPKLSAGIRLTAFNSNIIFKEHQYWRLFTFFLAQEQIFYASIFGIIIWFLSVVFVFFPIGYLHELTLGTKKTVLIILPSLFLLSLLQLGLTKTSDVYYFGIQAFNWIFLGSLLFVYFFSEKHDKQFKVIIKNTLIRGFLFTILLDLIKTQEIYSAIGPENLDGVLIDFSLYYWAFPLVSLFLGMVMSFISLNYKTLPQNTLFGVFGGLTLILIIAIVFIYLNSQDNTSLTDFVKREFSYASLKKIFSR